MNLKYSIFFLYTFSLFAKQTININSLYHHKGPNKGVDVELGSIVATFSEATIPTVLAKSQENDHATTILLFPNVSYKEGKSDAIEGSISGNGYRFSIKEVSKPHKGLACTISYQTSTVSLLYESIKHSTGKTGYIFRFINKKALKELDEKNKESSLMLLVANQRPRVMVDPGHGGTDFGACGHELIEKELALLVSKRIVQQLRSDGYDALLTRLHDENVTLSDRTTIANQAEADIFVSIHANSAPNPNACGIETFFYDGRYQDSLLPVSDLKTLTFAYQKYAQEKTKNAELLAQCVQKAVCEKAKSTSKTETIDRMVKKGPFQVVIGPIVPAILVEIGFISNEKEAEQLKKASYQKKIAQGICAGILNYFKAKMVQRVIA